MMRGITMDHHLPSCPSEAVSYINFVSTLVDDGDGNQGIVSRNDILALWDEYAGPNRPDGKFLLDPARQS